MPMPRKPTAEHELSGAFKHDPARGRARAKEPKWNGPLGAPPEHFSDLAKELWFYVETIIPPRVMQRSDRLAFESLVLLKEKEVLGTMKTAELAQYIRLLVSFGLTPADRSRVQQEPEPNAPENDPLAELVKRKGMAPAN